MPTVGLISAFCSHRESHIALGVCASSGVSPGNTAVLGDAAVGSPGALEPAPSKLTAVQTQHTHKGRDCLTAILTRIAC